MTIATPLVDLREAADPAQYGTKAATLAALHAAAIPVPPGKVLAAQVGDQYLPSAAAQLAQWAEQAGHELLVVRSSATGEDGTRSSFAGIYQSSFIPATPEHLHRALRRVRQSVRADTALAYARTRGTSDDSMAILTQPALLPAAAGVVAAELTARTLTAWRIEAVRGLAEPLVTGRTTGEIHTGSTHETTTVHPIEQFTVVLPGTEPQLAIPPGDWIDLPALDGPVAAKINTSADGLLHVHTPPAYVNQPILPIQHRIELLHITERAARALALPAIDLEWILDPNGTITITQARPLTSALPPTNPEGTNYAGIPAAPGIAVGPIVHLNQNINPAVVPGSILVCSALDTEAVAILLHRPAGLISITGGPLSHTAIIARELSIPCITNVTDAYTALRPGRIVRIDGTTGTITASEAITTGQSTIDANLNGAAVLTLNPAAARSTDARILTLRLRYPDDSDAVNADSSIGTFQPTPTPPWPPQYAAARDLTLPDLGRLLLPHEAPVPRKIAVISPQGTVLHHRMVTFDPSPKHIVWDWNGTLLDDNHAVLTGINAVCAAYNREPITLDMWRCIYQRPPRTAYEQLLEIELTDTEFQCAIQIFNTHSARARRTCSLTESTRWALKEWVAAGNTQSLLSMTTQSEFLAEVHDHNLDAFFAAINGRNRPDEPTKTELLHEHLATHQIDPTITVLIGDSIDDAHAANTAGIRCILVPSGTTSRTRLDAIGVPVVNTLPDAMQLLGVTNKRQGPGHQRGWT